MGLKKCIRDIIRPTKWKLVRQQELMLKDAVLIEIQQQLLPDLLVVMRKRYLILRQVMLSESIGRRSLAASLDMTERVLRAETDFLKSQDLLIIDAAGMRISDSGKRLLEEMEPLYKVMFGLSELEERIRKLLWIKAGCDRRRDSENSLHSKRELGRAGCSVLRKAMGKNDVIAVTGGSTLAQVANQLTSQPPLKGNWFVPARGGLGESLDYQANTIASTMAKRTGAQYRMLHVPDHLGEEAYHLINARA